ncbi:sugar-binding transcriptional regulator [Kluyvera intermedia]|uniref:sugar-binding transcriptional regulator n=1 Tax=Kluyvera intermedia TaxID=61648 RepID=UPI001F488476|nr:sugar-binding transcriptional regulator [Kluyvera intermedia]EKU4733607.1 sugar-binding transcriptional regulator [Kluyvera ascorbata]MCE9887588.1 sugar-binding transcriptional regulator [Kluyvera intermedia]
MENSDDIRLIVKIAQLYYEQEMTQAQIAQTLGIYRTTISRLLKRGRELGIVSIAINYDYNDSLWLEQQLKLKFGLKEAVVAPQESETGLYGAHLVERLLTPGMVVGFGWGRGVSALVEQLSPSSQPHRLVCVPVVGGPAGKLPSRFHVNTLTYSAASRLKAESHLADFPALLDNATIRNGIMQSQHFKTIAEYWQQLDIALVGIGSPAIRHGANWQAFYGNEHSDDLVAHRVAGDICSRFFDSEGLPVHTAMQEKTLAIELDTLRKARYAIGIAYGEEKHAALLGALRGKHINSLVTDRATAEYLVQ